MGIHDVLPRVGAGGEAPVVVLRPGHPVVGPAFGGEHFGGGLHREVRIEPFAFIDGLEHAAHGPRFGRSHAARVGGCRVERDEEQRRGGGNRDGASDDEGLLHDDVLLGERLAECDPSCPYTFEARRFTLRYTLTLRKPTQQWQRP